MSKNRVRQNDEKGDPLKGVLTPLSPLQSMTSAKGNVKLLLIGENYCAYLIENKGEPLRLWVGTRFADAKVGVVATGDLEQLIQIAEQVISEDLNQSFKQTKN